ncbi:MAG TPA: hypothetical protein ENG92_05185, partial [Thiolapillus brandeum]|nr:hypothetical protein [Thiolapillus brandeum]
MQYLLKRISATAALLFSISCSMLIHAQAPASLEHYQEVATKSGVLFNLPQWEKTPAQINAATETAISTANQRLDIIARRQPQEMTFANTIAALDDAYYPAIAVSHRMNLIHETNSDKTMRDAAYEAIKRLEKWLVDTSFRRDVYQVVNTFAATKPKVTGEDAKYLKTVLRDYRRNGMELPDAKRRQLQKLKNRLNELQLEFQTNITNANTLVVFSRKELEGVSDDFLGNKEILDDDGNYRVNANVTWQI